jgi:hypothetical protein
VGGEVDGGKDDWRMTPCTTADDDKLSIKTKGLELTCKLLMRFNSGEGGEKLSRAQNKIELTSKRRQDSTSAK